jgi:hypothetical protein
VSRARPTRQLVGVTELLRGADALRLATLEEHGLKRGVEVARDCYAVHEPDLDVRVTRQKAVLGEFFLEGREDGARHRALRPDDSGLVAQVRQRAAALAVLQAFLISIFCCFFATSAGFGKWMCNTPLSNFASTFAGSGSNGKGIARLNEP